MTNTEDSCLDTTKLTERDEYDIYEQLLDGLGSPVLARWAASLTVRAISRNEALWKNEIHKLIHERYQDSIQSSRNLLSATLAGIEAGSKS